MMHINISRITALLILTSAFFLQGCSSTPVSGGVIDGQLASCPSTPNCISSYSTRSNQVMAPMDFTGSQAAAMKKLKTVLEKRGDNKIVEENNHYLHVEFTTPIMHFVDDGEFLFTGHEISVRSASRIGYSDFGKNRSRLEQIRDAFEPCCQ